MNISLKNKTIIVTGASRGIGRAIALRCAKEGANVAILAKTAEENPKLPGTIYSVAEEVKALGGNPLPIQVDLRDAESIQVAVQKTATAFGGVDALINNAGVLNITDTLNTSIKRFDLMFGVNIRAPFFAAQAAIPYLRQAENPHIINISPPLNLDPKWFKNHLVYTISKYDMSMCTIGMSAEFAQDRIAVNSLWPMTAIATTAVEVHFPPEVYAASRKPEIMGDAAYLLLTADSTQLTGNLFTDEEVLKRHGITDLSHYAMNKENKLIMDAFLD